MLRRPKQFDAVGWELNTFHKSVHQFHSSTHSTIHSSVPQLQSHDETSIHILYTSEHRRHIGQHVSNLSQYYANHWNGGRHIFNRLKKTGQQLHRRRNILKETSLSECTSKGYVITRIYGSELVSLTMLVMATEKVFAVLFPFLYR